MAEATKTCPACAEEILAVARKCRHCGEFSDETDARLARGRSFAPCHACGETSATPITFTWWGGLVGPRLFSHVKCNGCGAAFNGKTGRSNTTNIALYMIVLVVVALVGLGVFALVALA